MILIEVHRGQTRHRRSTNLAHEAATLDEVLNDAAQGGVVVIPRLKPAIEAKFSKTVALST